MTTVLLVVALVLLLAILAAVGVLLRSVGTGRQSPEMQTALAHERTQVAVEQARVRSEQAGVSADQDRVAAERAQVDVERMRVADEAERLAAQARAAVAQRLLVLERVAGLTADAARAEVVQAVTADAERRAAISVRDIEAQARELADDRARAIVADAVQRIASDQTAESVVAVLALPGEDYKGRIIGREGRNIRAFEAVTGVNLVIDDTPDAVLLSCFDPVRREIGKVTLERLLADGRLSPPRIESSTSWPGRRCWPRARAPGRTPCSPSACERSTPPTRCGTPATVTSW